MRRVIGLATLSLLALSSLALADVLAPVFQEVRQSGFRDIRDLVATPDGAFIYGNAVGLARDTITGSITEITNGGAEFPGGVSLALAPGGTHLYYIGFLPGEIHAFSRNADGSVTRIQDLTEGVDFSNAIAGASRIAVSPDGTSVFVASLFDGLAVFARDTSSGQLTLQQQFVDGTGAVTGLAYPNAVAVSADGTSVYVAAYASSSVAFFSRNPGTGMLAFQAAYVDGSGGVDGLSAPQDVRASDDGKNVYVAGAGEDAIAVFARDTGSGALTFLEVQRSGVGGVQGLHGVTTLALSGDGNDLYAASPNDNAVAHFARSPLTGALTFVDSKVNGTDAPSGLDEVVGILVVDAQLYSFGDSTNVFAQFDRDPITGSLSFVAQLRSRTFGLDGMWALGFSPDGRFLYAASRYDGSLITYERDTLSGEFSRFDLEIDQHDGVNGLGGALDLAVSPDGAFIYVAATRSVSVFARHPSTGKTSFVEAQIQDVGGVDGLESVQNVALSPDGSFLYAGGPNSIAVFARDSGTGALSFSGRYDSQAGPLWTEGAGDVAIAVSPDGRHVYLGGRGEYSLTDVDLAIAIFDRDPLSGALTFHQRFERIGGPDILRVHELAFSADGLRLYAAGSVFVREPLSGGLTVLEDHPRGLNGVESRTDGMVAAPDGAHVYSFSRGFYDVTGLNDFQRDAGTGGLLLAQGKRGGTEYIFEINSVAVSPDSRYVALGGHWFLGWVVIYERTVLCPAAPRNDCLALPGRSLLGIRNDSIDKRDRLSFKWLRGDATSIADIGDPIHGRTNYAVCVYDGNGLQAAVHAPYGEHCVKNHDCWKLTGPATAPTGIRYGDFYRSPEGIQSMQIRFGSAAASQVKLKANGASLPALPTAALTAPVTAQVVSTDGSCWSAAFSSTDVKVNSSQSAVPLNFRAVR